MDDQSFAGGLFLVFSHASEWDPVIVFKCQFLRLLPLNFPSMAVASSGILSRGDRLHIRIGMASAAFLEGKNGTGNPMIRRH
jgi:hypothetical protein